MSRIIVKNLPDKVTDDRLRRHFCCKGAITDVKRIFTKDGKFRNFAFIGFKTEKEAENARSHFDKSYIDGSKIVVEICADLGDPNKPKAWSKYSKEKIKNEEGVKEIGKKRKKEDYDENDKLKQLKCDPQFNEFLELHKRKDEKSCANDTGAALKFNEGKVDVQSESSDEDEGKAKKAKISDLEFLKSKMVDKKRNEFCVKIKNLPYKCKQKNIKEFLPVKPFRVVKKGEIAFVYLKTEKDLKRALAKHRSFIGDRRIDVVRVKKKIENTSNNLLHEEKTNKWDATAKKLENVESVGESGRLFIRNLPYSTTEDELSDHFAKYGKIVEVHLPFDKYLNSGVGYGYITYMFPDHAVKALAKEDGKTFQGRIIQILPSNPKKNEENTENEKSSFKKKKAIKEKSLAQNSYNWNTLFLGTDAVVNTMAKKYGTTKSHILDSEANDSLGVRVALGETQIVIETKKFLESHGVDLSSISQMSKSTERSKTVILVKNLPANASAEELRTKFAKYGSVVQVLLPPHGITAIVEFIEPSNAREAFCRLAYAKFEDKPLYLEWAPVNTFNKNRPNKFINEEEKMETKSDISNAENEKKEEKTDNREKDSDDDDSPPEDKAMLFVKNLSFDTTDEALREHFKSCGPIHSASVSKKANLKEPGTFLSMGFGFVQFKYCKDANKALETKQNSMLNKHCIVLKRSDRQTQNDPKGKGRKQTQKTKQTSSKIHVKNIPFQANKREVEALFKPYGILTSVRLPPHPNASHHRGFAFVEYTTKEEAKRAFDALGLSSHLYGRRLVLEWAADDSASLPDKSGYVIHRKPQKKNLISNKTNKRYFNSD